MLKTRALSALVFAPPFIWVLWVGGLPLVIACLLLAALMLWEFFQLVLGPGQHFAKALGYVSGMLVAALVLGLVPSLLTPYVLSGGTLLLLTAFLLRPDPIPQAMQRAGLIVLGALYGGALITHLALLRQGHAGAGLALMALFCTWASDTGAYFAGKAFGRHKLYPKISPGKTIEGAFGGLAAAIGAAFLIRFLFDVPLPAWALVVAGATASIFGAIGDLVESLLKRSVGAKDSSRLIPGHGGVLDRFDGVMFAAAALYVASAFFVP